jgi:hypothetical protein
MPTAKYFPTCQTFLRRCRAHHPAWVSKILDFPMGELEDAKAPAERNPLVGVIFPKDGAVKGELQHPTTTIMWRINSRSQLLCRIRAPIALISQFAVALICLSLQHAFGMKNDLANILRQLQISKFWGLCRNDSDRSPVRSHHLSRRKVGSAVSGELLHRCEQINHIQPGRYGIDLIYRGVHCGWPVKRPFATPI